jgi:hypothetical protein
MKLEFIAWDRDKREWVDPNSIFIRGNGLIGLFGKPFITKEMGEPKNISIYPYIGRKDKNGKKVYNGSLIAILRENKIIVQRTIDVDDKYIKDNIPPNLGCAGTPWAVIGHIAEEVV